ncbi:MAG: hypothetical protein PF569_09930 [Candidatus Woesearchaeota archaeon]|nr:hypothetical protein [Candidatus Woesearchaeota archaeon]
MCSNINIALRDLDFSRSSEEALFGLKRSFHPLQEADPNNKLPESSIYNKGYKEINSKKSYFELPDVPFLKNTFNTRIHYSQPLQESSFKNGNRIFIDNHYRDYSNEYGAIVKLVERFGTLIAVMEKGILMIPVNERALMANASGENVYVNTENVLPKNPKVISDSFGSM